MHRSLRFTLVAAAAAAALLLPGAAFAPTETEPNDDPSAGDYVGAVPVSAAPAVETVDGTLADGDDVDVFSLTTAADGPAVVLLTGYTDSVSFQALHSPGHLGDFADPGWPYAFRAAFGWTLLAPAAAKANRVGIAQSTAAGANAYLLRVVRPGPEATIASAKAVFKEAAASDSFQAKLRYPIDHDIGPGTSGTVDVYFRDFHAALPAADFVANRSGTRFTWKGGVAGVRKVVWDSARGSITVTATKVDLASPPTEGSLPVAVVSGEGGSGRALAGTPKGTTRVRISAKVR